MFNVNVRIVKLMKSVLLILVQLHILVSLNQLAFEVCIITYPHCYILYFIVKETYSKTFAVYNKILSSFTYT